MKNTFYSKPFFAPRDLVKISSVVTRRKLPCWVLHGRDKQLDISCSQNKNKIIGMILKRSLNFNRYYEVLLCESPQLVLIDEDFLTKA